MNTDLFIKKIMEMTNIQDKHVAQRGIQFVFSILSHRLEENEAKDVAVQLPHELRRMWNNDVWITNYYKLSVKRLNYRHKIQLITLVENEILREHLPIHAESLINAVFHVLKESISAGEIKDITAQLPDDIKNIFKAA